MLQRVEIDRQEYEDIKVELAHRVETVGTVTTIQGRHDDHGEVVLIRQAGRFFLDADDVSHIRAKGETQG